jgi:hypothetical protein
MKINGRKHTGRRWRGAPLAVAAVALTAAVAAPAVQADTFGQVTAWGSPGTAADQFFKASELGVDPADNSVYVLDAAPTNDAYRLQKFSSTGMLKATATIPRTANGDGNLPLLKGVAVDSTSHRVYLLQYRNALDATTGALAAEQILVYSTDDRTGSDGDPVSGDAVGTLHAPSDRQDGTLPLPSPSGPDALDKPIDLEVDPSTHDLLVLAQQPTDFTAGSIATIQRISDAGVPGQRFVDSTVGMAGVNGGLTGMAVAPDGTVYVKSGNFNSTAGGVFYRLPSTLDSVTQLPWTGDPSEPGGPGSLAATEGWLFPAIASTTTAASGGGPQLAISPDGSTLYWSEFLVKQAANQQSNVIVRALDVAHPATSAVFGGTPYVDATTSCSITGYAPALAPGDGGVLYVLDHGGSGTPTFGQKVIEFGPGGSGCPAPIASFQVGGTDDSAVTVEKGQSLTFTASQDDLHGATPTELDWDFDGTGAFATTVAGSPASLTIDHTYLHAGTYTVGLKMKVSGSALGDPPPAAVKTVTVTSPAPTASFTATPASPTPGQAVAFDASLSVDPTGSDTATPTHALKSYSWDFGDGATQTTTTATVTHAFANGGTAAIARTVRLTVTSNDDVASAAVSRTVNVQGASAGPGPGDPGPGPGPGITTPTPPPPGDKVVDKTPPPTGAFTLVSAKAKGTTGAVLSLKVPGAGRLSVKATAKVKTKVKGKAKTKTITVGTASASATAGAKTVTFSLSSAAKAALKAGSLKVTVQVTFTPAGGKAVTKTTTLTLKQAPAKKAKAKH